MSAPTSLTMFNDNARAQLSADPTTFGMRKLHTPQITALQAAHAEVQRAHRESVAVLDPLAVVAHRLAGQQPDMKPEAYDTARGALFNPLSDRLDTLRHERRKAREALVQAVAATTLPAMTTAAVMADPARTEATRRALELVPDEQLLRTAQLAEVSGDMLTNALVRHRLLSVKDPALTAQVSAALDPLHVPLQRYGAALIHASHASDHQLTHQEGVVRAHPHSTSLQVNVYSADADVLKAFGHYVAPSAPLAAA